VSERFQELARRLRARWQDRHGRWQVLAFLAVLAIFVRAMQILLAPFFDDLRLYGFHDWDAHSAYRYITVVSLTKYHEMPFWHPWFCGGYPAWAFSEGATNLVSPYLPAYLALPVQIAERVEVVGSALTGLLTTYLFAGRFTKSVGLRALCAVVYAINGRWALQISTGHTWHLQYAWLPLALWFYCEAQDPGKARYAIYGGIVVALLVYMGGIYPLPHTVLALTIFMVVMVAAQRSLRPVWTLAIVGFCGLGFAAPKLFPMMEYMSRNPRTIDSPEFIDIRQLVVMMTDPMQSYHHAPIAIGPWGWHEFGIYIGLPAFIAMCIGLMFASRRQGYAPRIAGVVFLLLGFGSFHPNAPWPLLHKVPPFSSQHVPTRFLHTAVLMLTISFAVVVGRYLEKQLRARPWLDLLVLVPVYLIAVDIAEVGRKSTEHVFYLAAPPITPARDFHHEQQQPYNYSPPDWGGANLLSMFANTGRFDCYGVPIDPSTRGAIPKGTPGYRGEAYVVNAPGDAVVSKWSPSSAVVEYANAGEGAIVVYNMNWDPNWRADGEPAWEYAHAVAHPVKPGAGRVVFKYYPRPMNAALGVFGLTVLGAFFAPKLLARWWAARRSRRSPGDANPEGAARTDAEGASPTSAG
jgi:hypothetical protein